ncbi:MAG: hypothetical protein ACRCZ0_00745 [Cetobacterium sp.]
MTDITTRYPFNEICRWVVHKDTKQLVQRLGNESSLIGFYGEPSMYDETIHDIMVHFPAFYYKTEKKGNEILDTILHKVPTTMVYKGYKVSKAFRKTEDIFSSYILVGMSLGAVINGELRSVPNQLPTTGMHVDSFEDIMDQDTLDMIRVLYKFVHKDTNSQHVVGNGLTDSTGVTPTGKTMELGNLSGVTASGNISVLGLEDMYGNVKQMIKGTELTYDQLVVGGEVVPTEPQISNGFVSKTVDGNTVKPVELTGTANTHYTDMYEVGSDADVKRAPKLMAVVSSTNGVVKHWSKNNEHPLGWETSSNLLDEGCFANIDKESVVVSLLVELPNNRIDFKIDEIGSEEPELETFYTENEIDISSTELTGNQIGGIK